MAGVRKVAWGHAPGEKSCFVHFQVQGFSSFADNMIHPSVYQSKWSVLKSRTHCPPGSLQSRDPL